MTIYCLSEPCSYHEFQRPNIDIPVTEKVSFTKPEIKIPAEAENSDNDEELILADVNSKECESSSYSDEIALLQIQIIITQHGAKPHL